MTLSMQVPAKRRWRRRFQWSVGAALGTLLSPALAAAATVSPVISGLNSPRGLAFDAQGSLYVAESGRWLGTFGATGPSGQGITRTGSVRKYTGVTKRAKLAWKTPFASLYNSDHGVEVLGPEGVSALGADCTSNTRAARDGCQIQMLMSETQTGYAATHGGTRSEQIGHLFRLEGRTGKIRADLSNVGDQQYAWTIAHPELDPEGKQFPDANPYGVLVTKSGTYVVDSGANTLSKVAADGTARVLAYIHPDGVGDATPTCVAQGPDGALYVGTLNFFKNGIGANPGNSDVWRVDPRRREGFRTAAKLWATGLTTVTACAFDRDGNFWAAEMFYPNAGATPPGDIARIPFKGPKTVERFGGGQLPLPGGIAFGSDGNAYVSVGSTQVTAVPVPGAVVRFTTPRRARQR